MTNLSSLDLMQIIKESLIMTGILQLSDDPTADQLEIAISKLNDVFRHLSFSRSLIPYFESFKFNLVPTKSKYYFSQYDVTPPTDTQLIVSRKISLLGSVKLVSSNLSYKVSVLNFSQFNSMTTYYLEQFTNASPYNVYMQNDSKGSLLTFVPINSSAYECQLQCIFELPDIQNVYEDYPQLTPEYSKAVKFLLTKELCLFFNSPKWTDMREKELRSILNEIKNNIDIDTSINQDSFKMRRRLYYQY